MFLQRPLLLGFILISGLFLATTSKVEAVTVPHFPVCTNPAGAVIAHYDSGVHGIPGDYSEHRGSDTVYKLDENQVLQCFCAEDGTSGIQTLWWKVTGLNETDREILRRSGWVFIPNGALWGLDGEPYMAKSADYSCRGTGGGQGGIGGGSVLGATTGQVLGLADTGTTTEKVMVIGGSLLFATALILNLKRFL